MYELIIIDDEKKILDGISEIFPWENIGFRVAATFTSGRAALNFMQDNKIDVVMTDISMPDMNGLELARHLKAYEDLHVVFFSSYSDYAYMREALHLDITDYLLKPVSYSDLLTCFGKIKEDLDQKNAVTEQREVGYYNKIIRTVDEYLETNFQKASLTGASELVGISSGYLSKLYKEKKGIGFLEYLNRIRMEKAGEMMMDPAYKSYEVAYYVGYDSPKNFTRAFKAYYNVTPRDYRNGIRSDEEPKQC